MLAVLASKPISIPPCILALIKRKAYAIPQCGIAYALRFIRANIQGGIEIGFDAKTASIIAAQTIKGSAELLIQTGNHPEQEIDKVTTPKGCTIAGLNEMEHRGFSSSLIRGVVAVSYTHLRAHETVLD